MTGQVPTRTGGPSKSWKFYALRERILDALHALPSRFRSSLRIAGISAADLFTLNTPLGAAIEQSVVENLNELRDLWDPQGEYEVYSFVRQSQVFPDVLLTTTAPGVPEDERIILGVELKGWFILSREGEPSFRYKASPNVCAPQDLLVVYPWALDEVISGTPRIMRPFVEEARYAAEQRNYYWENLRKTTGSAAKITLATHQTAYPNKGLEFNDRPVSDSGGNFGRIARSRIMDDFIEEFMKQPLSGIPASFWQSFFAIFAEGVDPEEIKKKLTSLRADADRAGVKAKLDAPFDKIEEGLRDIISTMAK